MLRIGLSAIVPAQPYSHFGRSQSASGLEMHEADECTDRGRTGGSIPACRPVMRVTTLKGAAGALPLSSSTTPGSPSGELTCRSAAEVLLTTPWILTSQPGGGGAAASGRSASRAGWHQQSVGPCSSVATRKQLGARARPAAKRRGGGAPRGTR